MTNKLISALSVSALALTFAAGCATDLDGSDQPASTTDDSQEVTLSPRIHDAFVYFVRRGLTRRQAAGIVGNLMQESMVNPQAVQQGGPGRGIAQWSVGGRWDTSYHDNMTWYANKLGANRWALGPQLQFIWDELTTFPTYGLHALRNATTIDGATIRFMTDYEICGQCDSTNRIRYAHEVFNTYASTIAADEPTIDADVDVTLPDEVSADN